MGRTYVISDIHGCLTEFNQMLDLIEFKSEDTLYVIGDCVDRGADPLGVLMKCLSTKNIKLIRGNHEQFMIDCRKELLASEKLDYDDPFSEWNNWVFNNGGKQTRNQMEQLSIADRRKLLGELIGLPLYKRLEVGGKKYVLVHAGLGYQWEFREERELSKYNEDTLLWTRPNLMTRYYQDITVLIGHTPTRNFHTTYGDNIVHAVGKIFIDCGCCFNGKLGCICLDDMHEYYVDKENKE